MQRLLTTALLAAIGSVTFWFAACYPDKRNRSTRIDASPPDLTSVVDSEVASDAVEDGKIPADAYVPATCEMEQTCTTSDDCPSTHSCAHMPKLIWWCEPTCAPDPGKGGDCTDRPLGIINPYDNGQSIICLEDVGCNSVKISPPCPPGTVCQPGIGGTTCGIPGPKDLDDECQTNNTVDIPNNCKYPYICVPTGTGTTGYCRAGCDSYPGGPATVTCPAGEECVNFIGMIGINMGHCCRIGTQCITL